MKILIELPTWLGDAVMVTPAIENLSEFYNDAEITLIGSSIAVEALKNHPKVSSTVVLIKKKKFFLRLILSLGKFDIFFSFRSSLRSKFMKFFIPSTRKFQYDKKKYLNRHQVIKYNSFVNISLGIEKNPGNLILYSKSKKLRRKHKLLGINPGAKFGSSKRWYPKEFAEVAISLSSEYDIVILGGLDEKDIASEIEKYLNNKGIFNYHNLAGKTSITELIEKISNLDLFITGDSGSMHIAAALQIPSVTIFGPTRDLETSQWMNEKSIVVKKNLDCQPCMKRTCPLKHHNCMTMIKAKHVIGAVQNLDL